MSNKTIFCPHCGKKIPANSVFCPHCGQKVAITSKSSANISNKQPEKTHNSKKQAAVSLKKKQPTKLYAIIAALVVIFGLLAFGHYYYNETRQIDRIVSALGNPKKNLKHDVTTNDPNLKVTNDALKSTQKYYSANKDKLSDLSEELKDGGGDGQISIVRSGRAWLLFPRYKAQINSVYATIGSNHAKTTVYADGQKAGQVKHSSEDDLYSYKVGPLFPGTHKFTVKSKLSNKKVSSTSSFNILSSTSKNMDIQTADLKVSGLPNGKIYLDDKKIGNLNGDGKAYIKNAVINNSSSLYTTAQLNKKTIKSKKVYLYNLINDDDDPDYHGEDNSPLNIQTKFAGMVSKEDAEDLLGDAFIDVDDDDDDDIASDFVGGSSNSDYSDLRKLASDAKNNDEIIDSSTDVSVKSLKFLGNNQTQVTYTVDFKLDMDDDSTKSQHMEYTNCIIQKSGGSYKIKVLGSGKMISQSRTSGDDD